MEWSLQKSSGIDCYLKTVKLHNSLEELHFFLWLRCVPSFSPGHIHASSYRWAWYPRTPPFETWRSRFDMLQFAAWIATPSIPGRLKCNRRCVHEGVCKCSHLVMRERVVQHSADLLCYMCYAAMHVRLPDLSGRGILDRDHMNISLFFSNSHRLNSLKEGSIFLYCVPPLVSRQKNEVVLSSAPLINSFWKDASLKLRQMERHGPRPVTLVASLLPRCLF